MGTIVNWALKSVYGGSLEVMAIKKHFLNVTLVISFLLDNLNGFWNHKSNQLPHLPSELHQLYAGQSSSVPQDISLSDLSSMESLSVMSAEASWACDPSSDLVSESPSTFNL